MRENPERTEELQGLGKCDPDFLNGDVVKDVGHRDAGDSGNGENQIYEPGHVYRCCNISKSAGQWKKKGRSDETNKPKTANRTELGGRTFNEHTVERPARRSDKSNPTALEWQRGPCRFQVETKKRRRPRVIPITSRPEIAIAGECAALPERK